VNSHNGFDGQCQGVRREDRLEDGRDQVIVFPATVSWRLRDPDDFSWHGAGKVQRHFLLASFLEAMLVEDRVNGIERQ